MEIIVDIQGFKEPHNDFIIKEFAAIKIQNNDKICILFKPPYPWDNLSVKYKCINNWSIRNYHGLSWECGDIPYNEMKHVINDVLKSATYIYIKGLEKKKWLENIMENTKTIIDLHDMNAPSLKTYQKKTIHYHAQKHYNIFKCNCALENILFLSTWFKEHWDIKPSFEKSTQLFCILEDLSKMTKEDITQLPENFILLFAFDSIDEAWDKLPGYMQEKNEFIMERRCTTHFKKTAMTNSDIFDGPIPLIKNCSECKKLNK